MILEVAILELLISIMEVISASLFKKCLLADTD